MAGRNYQPLTLTPINFSLTDGTSIPAPADTPPDTPGPLSLRPTPKSAFFPHTQTTPPNKDASKSSGETDHVSGNLSPLSPSSPTSRRSSSVRNFFGLRPLSSHGSIRSNRPGSPVTIGSHPSLKRKKSSSWFGKAKRQSSFIGSLPEGKESSVVFHANDTQAASPPAQKGPPPPALPDLKTFGVSSDLGADDMFKSIK